MERTLKQANNIINTYDKSQTLQVKVPKQLIYHVEQLTGDKFLTSEAAYNQYHENIPVFKKDMLRIAKEWLLEICNRNLGLLEEVIVIIDSEDWNDDLEISKNYPDTKAFKKAVQEAHDAINTFYWANKPLKY